ncbi:MAG: RNA-protein complex protein Nop10 [Thermoplasmata archaeon]|nr:RNA-protein complex protein Nop10 [Thermoplasmatales archaeon]PMP73538.1 MAG: ribosome biogenesis protein [Aciduliprofundum sp.]
MKTRIRKCPRCKVYTLKEKCPRCGNDTVYIAPPRFSPVDRYGEYRRKYRMEVEKNG